MPINFATLKKSTKTTSVEPRDIFMSLPQKDKKYSYPRDVQTEVWKQWYEKRTLKNNVVKMNTGSGKTVVGLMILQSCLEEGEGPAVYVVPDSYLVQQVCDEADELGIKVVRDEYDETGGRIKKGEDDYQFLTGKAVLVINIHKLVNGKSVFGMRTNGNNIEIGSIILDDVHSCLDIIQKQNTISIGANHDIYMSFLDIFARHPHVLDSQAFLDIKNKRNPQKNYLVPFWIWQAESANIYDLLTNVKYQNENFNLFNFPLMREHIKTMSCVISDQGIELSLNGIPIDKISSFENAKRRIFMSATLSDDGALISAAGLKEVDLSNIITPEKADDIGERLILFPKLINSSLIDTQVKQKIVQLSENQNVVVIVPSYRRLEFWDNVPSKQVLSNKENNIEEGIKKLKTGEYKGLTILVNKYDGIDLPDDACRILVLDGLPTLQREYDMAVQGINPDDNRILSEQIQKIEQGMGRGVRSNSDFCVVILMGDKLANVLANQRGEQFFSSATQKQFVLSKQIWEQLLDEDDRPDIETIFSLANYSLNREPEWVSISKDILNDLEYEKFPHINTQMVAFREAFEAEKIEDYSRAFSILEKEKNSAENDKTKGFLMQCMAEYKNFSNPVEAQRILLSARMLNPMVLRPEEGIQIEKMRVSPNGQASTIVKYAEEQELGPDNYVFKANNELVDFIFSDADAKKFEAALDNVAKILGFNSQRPEVLYGGKAPDNLIALGNGEYAVIECKSRTTSERISKKDCSQLLSAVQWFRNQYLDTNLKIYPVMIHNSCDFSSDANPSPDFRIMTPELLDKFSVVIKDFSITVSQNNVFGNVNEIEKQLKHFKLLGSQIIDNYTTSFQTRDL
ncbi:DEAD/DEAH box helicase [Lactococcus lactis]|uniref:DEAD/DEAH box helicase n=1 Tax=Lactococcus lactis TaxID=1358 RepID=UPI0020275794|nr:DEAD/DEAH box helicase [Lactococcus lactis]MCL9638871.1 DEAD/DEAH box helicase family protein [Lactococcus lactis]MCT1182754.1 DEAD/DEAH box helicase [Lactococcus lactis]